MYTPTLPFRRLVEFANGIWDENRKTFYPYQSADATKPAKRGVMYFVKCVSTSCSVVGIAGGAPYLRVTATLRGNTILISPCVLPTTTQATDYFSVSNTQSPGVLCDQGTALTVSTANTTTAHTSIVYAEIPVEGTGTVVVQ